VISVHTPLARSLPALALATFGLGCPATPAPQPRAGDQAQPSPEPPARSDAPEFVLAGLRLLEFDHDRDRDRLLAAGCQRLEALLRAARADRGSRPGVSSPR
jgi:hypothetical protein